MKKEQLKAGALVEALKLVAQGKNVDTDVVMQSLKDALISAARKYINLEKRIEVDIHPETGVISVFLRVQVVEDYPDVDPALSAEEVEKLDEGFMLVHDAVDFNEDAQPGDMLEMEIPVEAFGRQAIQTAKQFLIQRVKEAERTKIYDTYKSKVGTLVSGTVQKVDGANAIISIGKTTEAVMPAREQIRRERLKQGMMVQAVIAEVTDTSKGAQVILSRANGRFLAELFKLEVPEIYEGTVEIRGIARDPGFRAKIAVTSRDERIDPVGACVGMKGNRVQSIVRELSNERIDIVHWSEDLHTYIRRSLSPANIVKIFDVAGNRRVVVIVAEEDLAQAIGRNGQNVRLASQLVGRELDVFGENEWAGKSDEEKQRAMTPREGHEKRGEASSNTRLNKLNALFRDTDSVSGDQSSDDSATDAIEESAPQKSVEGEA